MSWINDSLSLLNYERDTDYNRIVGISKTSIDNFLDSFDTIFNNFVNFTDEISSLRMYPFEIPCNRIGRLKTNRGTVSNSYAGLIDNRSKFITLGEYYVKRYYNNFADFNGYTQIKVFLPLLGYVDVDVNECMGKHLQFRLVIDYYTGKGMYIIGVSDYKINHNNPPYVSYGEDSRMRIISTFECDLAIDIPLGQSNMGDIKRNLILGAVKTAAAVGFSAYTASLPPATITTSSTTTYDVQGRSKRKGSRLKTIKSGTETTEKTTIHHVPVDKSKPYAEAIDGSIDALNRIHISGNTDRVNDAGLMFSLSTNIKVVIYRPKFVELNDKFGSLYGYPLGEVRKLSSVEGYTEINSIHFDNDGYESATQMEIAKLEEAFSNGVIFPTYSNQYIFTINGTIYKAFKDMTWGEWINSDYNTADVITVDDYIQIKVLGNYEYIYYNKQRVRPDDIIVEYGEYTTNTDTFTIDDTTYFVLEGMTWGEWALSNFNTSNVRWIDSPDGTGMQIKEGDIYKFIYYNNNIVNDTDIIVVNGSYTTIEPEETITFIIDDKTYNAIENMTWNEWIVSNFNTINARYVNVGYEAGIQIEVDGVYKFIYYNNINVLNTDSIISNGYYTTTEPYNFILSNDNYLETSDDKIFNVKEI